MKSQGSSAQRVGSQEIPVPGFLFQILCLGIRILEVITKQ